MLTSMMCKTCKCVGIKETTPLDICLVIIKKKEETVCKFLSFLTK